jgi:hypothetical protein
MFGAIGFESEEVQPRKLRDRSRLMSECRNGFDYGFPCIDSH